MRAVARLQGVEPSDADLEGVRAFLETFLPAAAKLEELVEPATPPAGAADPT